MQMSAHARCVCDDGTCSNDTVLPSLPPTVQLVSWQAHHVLLYHCEALTVAEKRQIFSAMREVGITAGAEHLYLPRYGLTFGEFSTLYIVSDHMRRVTRDTGASQAKAARH